MTHAQLRRRALKRLDQDPDTGGYFTPAEVTAALNRGQRIFAFLTLCLEETVTFPVTSGFYRMLATFPDWIVPVRVTRAGAKVHPATLAQLYALDEAWRSAAGAASHYGCMGFDLLFVRGAGTLAITYARMPRDLSADDDEPEIIDACHPCLIDYAIWHCRKKQGGQEFGKTAEYFARYLAVVKAAAADIKKRSIAAGNDRLPPEIAHFLDLLDLEVRKP